MPEHTLEQLASFSTGPSTKKKCSVKEVSQKLANLLFHK